MSKTVTPTSDDVRASVSSIYSDLLKKRQSERAEKEELRRAKEEEKIQKKEEKKEKKEEHMTKAERRQAELDSWKEIIVGLTGDDLEYSDTKQKRKKYRKWIDDDSSGNRVDTEKVKKPKKRNYHKEFEPELQMLKSLVADQNRFSSELLKRYQNAVGPNTKDAMPPNKTIVELIATINASRSNALGMLREIGNIKKTIADLYMKQKKLDSDLGGGSNISNTDLALLGSSVASSIFDEPTPQGAPITQYTPPVQQEASTGNPEGPGQVFQAVSTFDPNSWDGPELDANTRSVMYENIPHHVVVEWNKDANIARFKAVRDDTGEELSGAPVPTVDPSKLSFNEKDLRVKGQFDEIYPLEIVS